MAEIPERHFHLSLPNARQALPHTAVEPQRPPVAMADVLMPESSDSDDLELDSSSDDDGVPLSILAHDTALDALTGQLQRTMSVEEVCLVRSSSAQQRVLAEQARAQTRANDRQRHADEGELHAVCSQVYQASGCLLLALPGHLIDEVLASPGALGCADLARLRRVNKRAFSYGRVERAAAAQVRAWPRSERCPRRVRTVSIGRSASAVRLSLSTPWLKVLHELQRLDQPLRLLRKPGVQVLMVGDVLMRAGVHHATFAAWDGHRAIGLECAPRMWPSSVRRGDPRPWDGWEGFTKGDLLGIRLDIGAGIATAYKNGRRLGVMARALSGEQRWAVAACEWASEWGFAAEWGEPATAAEAANGEDHAPTLHLVATQERKLEQLPRQLAKAAALPPGLRRAAVLAVLSGCEPSAYREHHQLHCSQYALGSQLRCISGASPVALARWKAVLGRSGVGTLSAGMRQAAWADGDAGEVGRLLAAGEHPDAVLTHGITHYFPDPSLGYRTSYGNTALMLAACNGHEECVVRLVDGGATLDLKNRDGFSALHKAVMSGHLGVCRVLVGAGASVEQKIRWEAERAKRDHNTEVAAYLRDPEAFDKWRAELPHVIEALAAAAELPPKEQRQAALAVLDGKAATEGLSKGMRTAAKDGDAVEVGRRLEAGEHPDALQFRFNGSFYFSGWNALMWAAWNGHEECVVRLVSGGAALDLQDADSSRNTAIRFFQFWNTESLNFSRAALNRDGSSALHKAAGSGHVGVCRVLVSAGASVGLRYGGVTALMLAARQGHEECVDCLVDGGAALDQQEPLNGWSALHLAAAHGHRGVCRVLVAAGACVGLRNKNGKTALTHQQLLLVKLSIRLTSN